VSAAEPRPSFARRLATAPIRFYRRFLSPLKPPMCRFSPTCSEYARVAIEAHGILKGTGLAAWRVLRCNPLCRGGYDPVPGTDPRGPSGARGGAEPGSRSAVEPEAERRENPRR
jgi:putative membrane protein insertion efficiency factor